MNLSNEQLHAIADAYGGPKPLGDAIGYGERIVRYWLKQERPMPERALKLILSLPKAKKIAHSAK